MKGMVRKLIKVQISSDILFCYIENPLSVLAIKTVITFARKL